jgi:hypothetical protein
MIDKLKELGKKDPLIFHKLGLGTGAIIGILIGFMITDKAEQWEVQVIEEVTDGETKV